MKMISESLSSLKVFKFGSASLNSELNENKSRADFSNKEPSKYSLGIHGIWNPTLQIRIFSRKWCLMGEISEFNASVFKGTTLMPQELQFQIKVARIAVGTFPEIYETFSPIYIVDQFNGFIVGYSYIVD